MTESQALDQQADAVASEPAVAVVPPVVAVRELLGASFELLLRSGDMMRRASFYIGLIVLGTATPLALALWGYLVVAPGFDVIPVDAFQPASPVAGWFVVLLFLFVAGIIVASIESTGVAIALLGGEQSGRPVSIREAVQRSRMAFWSIVVAAMLVSIPTTIVQNLSGEATPVGVLLGLIAATLIQTPFVYAPAGIVLGGVGPIEALRRSIRIAGVRKGAAILLAILPSIYGFLVLLALGAGLDLTIRALEAVGLSADSGPVGVAVVIGLIVMIGFALGTLLFTVTAIVYAPQVVMFVGLTRATIGLDRVRPGGDHAVDGPAPGRPRFRWLTRPMLAGFGLGGIGLAGFLAALTA